MIWLLAYIGTIFAANCAACLPYAEHWYGRVRDRVEGHAAPAAWQAALGVFG